MFWRITQLLMLPIAVMAVLKGLGNPVWVWIFVVATLPSAIFSLFHWLFKGAPNGWQKNWFLVIVFYWLPFSLLLIAVLYG